MHHIVTAESGYKGFRCVQYKRGEGIWRRGYKIKVRRAVDRKYKNKR